MPTFPHEAFADKGLLNQLSRHFNLAAYTKDQVNTIRTSLYYSDFAVKDTALCYTATCLFAIRNPEKQFQLLEFKTRIEHSPLNSLIVIRSLPEETSAVFTAAYTESEIIGVLDKLAAGLEKQSTKSAAYQRLSPITLHTALHLSIAREIFDHPCKKSEIEYHLDRAPWPHP